jgi:hypothetical protein
MLKFSIRDLLWLTLVVAMGLGWWLREGQLSAQLHRKTLQAEQWRGVAGGMQSALAIDGWTIVWNRQEARVYLAKRAFSESSGWRTLEAAFCDPDPESFSTFPPRSHNPDDLLPPARDPSK